MSLPLKDISCEIVPNKSYIQPDLWPSGGWMIKPSDDFDKKYFGGDVLRVDCGHGDMYPNGLAIKIKITGRTWQREYRGANYRIRIEIEFLGDGEPSDFSGGWLYEKIRD